MDSAMPHSEPVVANPSFKLRINRGQSLIQLIRQFSNPDVVHANTFDITVILPNGQKEQGSGDGDFRDIILGFWDEFVDQCCVGYQQKVPLIRHDFQSVQWTSVARIILKGYQLLNYFPTFLSKSLIEEALYENHTSTGLLDCFMLYITGSEKQLFTRALIDFEKVDKEELLDALRKRHCRSIVTKDTLKPILLGIAHKEIIQVPRYIVKCWSSVLKDLGTTISSQQLQEIYFDIYGTSELETCRI